MLIKIGDSSHDVPDAVGIYVGQLEKKVGEHAKELKSVGDKAIQALKDKEERVKLEAIALKQGHKVDSKTDIGYLRGIADSAAQIESLGLIGGGTPNFNNNTNPKDYDAVINDISLGGI